MRTLLKRALLPSLCALAIGCGTSNGNEDAGSELEAKSGSVALVQIERFAATDSSLPRVVTGAKVARFQAIEGEALLKLLGASVNDLETCTLASGLDDLALAPEARVELLSVGDISLRVGETQQTLSPRLFPALATTASGWFYAGDAEIAEPRAELDEYLVAARGAEGVGAFELAVAAPSQVQGLELGGGAAAAGQQVVARGGDLELSWELEDPRDRVELEIYSGGSVLSCAFRDDGHFLLPHSRLAALESDENASIVARRVRVVSMDMHGIKSAYARIATTSTFAAHVR